ncbi:MAG: hypothetical protein SNJ84_04655 [Verrucomicrobiia bacterium]
MEKVGNKASLFVAGDGDGGNFGARGHLPSAEQMGKVESMVRITLITAALLIGVGVVGYFLTGMASWTALIPAFLGLLMGLSAVLAKKKESLHKHMMHAAAGIALVGLLGTWRGFFGLFRWIGGEGTGNFSAALAQGVTFLILAVFLGLCVRSFVLARLKA